MDIRAKILGKEDIQELINLLLKHYEINDLVKNVRMDNSKNLFGCYNANTRELFINHSLIVSTAFRKYHINIMNITNNDIQRINLDLLFYVFHEIEHVNQIKYINNGENKTLKDILVLGFDEQMLSCLNKDDKYSRFHDAYIHEYNANVLAAMKLSDYVDKIEAYKYAKEILYKHFCYGYYQRPDGLTCPTKEFLTLVEKDKEMPKDNNFDEYTKVAYGLPVDEVTYEKIKQIDTNEITSFKQYFNR